MCHIEHMKREMVTIRELHMHTGRWIRSVAESHPLVVTERGVPIATIVPFSEEALGRSFVNRNESAAFKKLPRILSDSTSLIADDRERL